VPVRLALRLTMPRLKAVISADGVAIGHHPGNEFIAKEASNHMNLSRRDLLKGSAVLGLSALCRSTISAATARQPHFKFPVRPIDRLALTSWPFREYMEGPHNSDRNRSRPGMDIIGFARMAIEKFNIHNINPLSAHFPSTEPRHLDTLRDQMAKAGSHFVDLGLGAGKFYDPDPAVRKASVESSKRWIDIAVVLGSPSVRQHLGGSHGAKPDVNRSAQSLGELADYGAKKNIVVNLENDSLDNEDPFFIVKVIEKAGNPYLRALPDLGNTMLKGDPAYNHRGLKAMFEHAFNMSHVKDEVVSSKGVVYKIDLAKAFGIAKTSGYRGYFSMEWETKEGDPFEGTHRLVKETLHYLS
jgi:sugar phosphate isomerase/epimerase